MWQDCAPDFVWCCKTIPVHIDFTLQLRSVNNENSIFMFTVNPEQINATWVHGAYFILAAAVCQKIL